MSGETFPETPRFLGIDVGAETIKVVEVLKTAEGFSMGRRWRQEHGKDPGPVLLEILTGADWASVAAAAVTGRLSRRVLLPRIPQQQALTAGSRRLFGKGAGTVLSIGSHGFCVLELRVSGADAFRENSRCSQGTGNFLRQLVERFSMTIEAASELAAEVTDAEPLSGRCPVILKTDMTHLANKGIDRARILAGLFDAVCENILTLVKPGTTPPHAVLAGGVALSRRVRQSLQARLSERGMTLLDFPAEDGLYLEAFGAALLAAESPDPPPALETLIQPAESKSIPRVPPLAASRSRVRRMPPEPPAPARAGKPILLGLDIGSTGSKAVALDPERGQPVWQDYRRTNGNPVGAAQELVQAFRTGPAASCPVVAFGVTGSGREIVGSLLSSCYGATAVFVLNEIAAHAEGACHFEPRVDTIFEIGGQDAKYIRLAGGRVVDAAMNEACSAGTGSFIEEQCRKFEGLRDVTHMGQEALAAAEGVSLGQHCSVFMAEVIDEAVAQGVERRSILAGLYDSIIQNYLNRVKGNRSVGQVIFCQGMPFRADALAAAVARQTGAEVIVPPDPGTIGALGIARLTAKEIPEESRGPMDLERFLAARIEARETVVCKSTQGCGGSGNKCRINRIRTVVDGRPQKFMWGGGCSLYDKGARKRKLPDLTPDPFRAREEYLHALCERLPPRGRPRVSITDEFSLKGLFPFFATYLYELGFDPIFAAAGSQATLKRGIQESNVPFCAPLQLFHGVVSEMTDRPQDRVFLPMVRQLPRVAGEAHAVTCPLVQASPDIVRWDLSKKLNGNVLSPVIDFGAKGLHSPEFLESCRRMAVELGDGVRWETAHRAAAAAQEEFEAFSLSAGRRALDFCAEKGIPAVVVMGRPYTLYNTVLNSNVPALLREQGTVGIPVDCFPVDAETPVFADMYWGYGQRILRATHLTRRSPGVYAIYCSNYSCGPDSFLLHFYGYLMEGKPCAVIETDGHSGDAGTKTRIEAFLYCVEVDRREKKAGPPANGFDPIAVGAHRIEDVRRNRETLLVPWMGPASDAIAASFRAGGVRAESLPLSDAETLQLGRRHTSGKECLPMCLTLGSLLQRLRNSPDPNARFALLMPKTCGPCRFGVYNLLNRIVLEKLGYGDRMNIWAPANEDYFRGLPAALSALVLTGAAGSDTLMDALHDVRPTETRRGLAGEIYRRYHAELLAVLEGAGTGDLSLAAGLWQIASGRLFGVRDVLQRAANEFKAARRDARLPVVLVVGEIYVRLNAFANGDLIRELERRGLRVKLAPTMEWLEYADWIQNEDQESTPGRRLKSFCQRRIQQVCHQAAGPVLGWPARSDVRHSLSAAGDYLRTDLRGEATLTLGSSIHEWREGRIDAAVFSGPFECMPNKIAEAQGWHLAEEEGLLLLTVSMNGEAMDANNLDTFAFEVKARHARRLAAPATP